MIAHWHIPSFCGDFELRADEEDEGKSMLIVEDPTDGEMVQLGTFLAALRQRKWVNKAVGIIPTGRTVLRFEQPIVKVAPLMVSELGSARSQLTVVKSVGGQVTHTFDTDGLEAEEVQAEVAKAAEKAPPKATAATVRKPTSCCPTAVEGPVRKASRLLAAFCTPSQWAEWVEHGFITVRGHMSGHWYRICHRNTPLAVEQGKIVWDLTDNRLVHCYDWSVPPAEEVLAVKLLAEHREHWIRNTATVFGGRGALEHPYGDIADGTADATLFRHVGEFVEGALVGAVAGNLVRA